MKKKLITAVLAVTMAVGMLTGCGSGTGTGKREASGEKLVIWTNMNVEVDTIQKYADEWGEKNGRKVEVIHQSPSVQQFAQAVKSASGPDAVVGIPNDQLADYVNADLTAEVPQDLYADQDFSDAAIQACYVDGKRYAAPLSVETTALFYNTDLVSEVPKTWDEFFKLGDTLKDIDGRALFTYQGIYPGYMEEMLWPAIANECGEEALTKIANYEEGSFNNEGVLKALSHIKEIADKGYLLEGTVGMNHTESQTEMMLGKAAFITNGTWMENEMQDAPREDGFEFAMAPIPTENADDVHYVFDSCEQFSIPAAAKNPELAKEFLRFLYSDESVSAFAEASGALYATKSAREVAKDKLSTAIYNMYGIYEEANASSLIMSFAAVPADCKVNPKDEIFNPITSVMNDEMTVEEWAQNVEDAFAQVRADMEAAN